MIFAQSAHSKPLRPWTLAALPLCLCALALGGCNDKPGEKIDNRPPTDMPMPATVKGTAGAADKNPATAVIPPPTEAELGMPIYPGAKTYVDATGNPVPAQKGGSMPMAMLETADPVDKVVDFYRQRITETNAGGAATPVEPREDKQDNGKRKVSLSGSDAQGNVLIALIREDNNKTAIELMRAQLSSGTSDQTAPTGAPGRPDAAPAMGTPSAGTSGAATPPAGGTR